ncbi:complex I subunit 4 family protein [Entomobacter blattae]|uniref:NADH-quinone oxidoreductase subunit M n=1 Tax=Entomobacter blattae TaxID=2762277 RepID=A0A7H1NUQ2_9PROT|nr:NADH-quinone oxidoreductase subunit M [Entomobacter blattae]QNT79512.1 NADH-quinone oxidoreductase subunit M [Entomobacter blattae]
MHTFLLPLITYLPLLGVFLLAVIHGNDSLSERFFRWTALWVSLLVFGLSVILWTEFDATNTGYQFTLRLNWLSGYGISYHTGVDGISLFFILLTTFITPLAIVSSWHLISTRVKEFMIAVLLLETCLVGLFSALDLLVFYVFYEATLIPSSIMIGVWGGPKRLLASLQFFIFTFASSLFMMVAILAIWNQAGTTDIPILMHVAFSPAMQGWLMLGFMIAFATKLPLFPLHAWLPDAYAESPSSATALISGVMSKTAAYGMLRFVVMMLPDAAYQYGIVVMVLGVIVVVYAAIIAFAQTDMKRVIAYSSFSHMGIIAIGLFSFTPEGIDGAIFQMLSHGVVIAALFFSLALLAFRTGTRDMAALGGVAAKMPVFSLLMMVFMMANVGLPGTSAFIGELLVIVGVLHVSFWIALLGGSSMILGAIYMLVLYRRVIFDNPAAKWGESFSKKVVSLKDLSGGELAALVPLAAVILWMGIYPSSFIRVFDPAVMAIAHVQTGTNLNQTAYSKKGQLPVKQAFLEDKGYFSSRGDHRQK